MLSYYITHCYDILDSESSDSSESISPSVHHHLTATVQLPRSRGDGSSGDSERPPATSHVRVARASASGKGG